MVLNNIVELKEVQLEKDGRMLAQDYCKGVILNNLLSEQHLAVSYVGGTKKCTEDWMVYYKEFHTEEKNEE